MSSPNNKNIVLASNQLWVGGSTQKVLGFFPSCLKQPQTQRSGLTPIMDPPSHKPVSLSIPRCIGPSLPLQPYLSLHPLRPPARSRHMGRAVIFGKPTTLTPTGLGNLPLACLTSDPARPGSKFQPFCAEQCPTLKDWGVQTCWLRAREENWI